MRRLTPLLSIAFCCALALGAPLVAQVQSIPAPAVAGQSRDPVPPVARGRGEPGFRRVPVGTGSIVGVVTTADSGRPIRGAQVMLSGMTPSMGRTGGAGAAEGRAAGGGLVVTPTVMISGSISGGSGQVFSMAPSVSRMVTTDAQGQFVFQRLPAGQFTISVNRNLFLSTNYGQKKPGGQGAPITLAEGQQLKINVPMMRGGVISGVVLGEDGEPQMNARVTVWRYTMNNGVKRLSQMNGASSDDHGNYRIFNLQPGDYFVSATPTQDNFMSPRASADMEAIERAIASGAIEQPAAPGMPATVLIPLPQPQQGPVESPAGYLPTFYPNTAVRANGAMVHINGGDERSGIDIQVQLVRATNITGAIAPVPSGVAVEVSLISDDPMNQGTFNSTRIMQDGKFTLRDVSPGRYTVLAQTVPGPAPGAGAVYFTPQSGPPTLDPSLRMWGRAAVTVDGQSMVQTNLMLQPGRSISGVVQFEMARPPDLNQARLTVMLNSTSGTPSYGPLPQAQVGPDGRFTLTGVIPGRYTVRASGTTKSSVIEGQDTLDFPLEFTGDRDVGDAVLTLTDKVTEIAGTLTDAAGKPAFDYTIIAAPVDSRFWIPGSRRIVMSRPGMDGRYVLRGLPPGDYLVAAVTDLEFGAQYDPELLRSLNGVSMRVTLAEGARIAQDLRIAR